MLIIPKYIAHAQTSTLNSRHPYWIVYWTFTLIKTLSRASNITCQHQNSWFPLPSWWPSPICSFLILHLYPWHHHTSSCSGQLPRNCSWFSLCPTSLHQWILLTYSQNKFQTHSSTSQPLWDSKPVISHLHYCRGWFHSFHSHYTFILHRNFWNRIHT